MPVLLPYPNAIILILFILSIVYWASFVIWPLIAGMPVVLVTLGTYLFGSSELKINYFCSEVIELSWVDH